MGRQAARFIRSAVAGILLLAIAVGVPYALWVVARWPLPTRAPDPAGVVTALEQGNIAAEVVINSLAVIMWLLWAQLIWALLWETIVNGRRLARGMRTVPAPLVLGPLNALAVKLVSGVVAAGIIVTTTGVVSLPASPTLASVLVGPDVAAGSGSVAPRADAAVQADLSATGSQLVVADGDSLWSIAEATLGDGARIVDLLELNPSLGSARNLRPGMVLDLPLGAAIPRDRLPAVVAFRSEAQVEVVAGDNLWQLSESRLENAGVEPSVPEVAEYVADVVARNDADIEDPDLIYPGEVFAFPQLGERPNVPPSSGPVSPPTRPGAPGETPENGSVSSTDLAAAGSEADQSEAAESGAARAEDGGSPDPGEVDGVVEDRGPALLGAAGSLLAAGALVRLKQRRRYRMAHRSPGTTLPPSNPELAPIERALNRWADEATIDWLSAAMASLASRPIWEGEAVAQPVLVTLDDDRLEIEFDRADPMAAPVPWTTSDDGLRWQLARSVPAGDLPAALLLTPTPLLVTVGAATMLNLEALGSVRISGTGEEPADLVRSIVHELATSPAGGMIDIRSSIPIAGTQAYGLVAVQPAAELAAELGPWLDDLDAELAGRSSANAFAQRVIGSGEPISPVVVITDSRGRREMLDLAAYARRRSLPFTIVTISNDPYGEDYAIDVDAHTAVLQPWDVVVESQLLSEQGADALGALLADAGEVELVPTPAPPPSPVSVPKLAPMPIVTEQPTPVADLQARARQRDERAAEAQLEPAPQLETATHPETVPQLEPEADRQPERQSEPQPEPEVLIRVLGDIEASGLTADLTSQQLSLLTFLACVGTASKATIIEALWDGQSISDSRFPNLLAETRAKVGRHRFPEAKDGRYQLVGVATDLVHFERVVAESQRCSSEDAVVLLRSIIEQIQGVPFSRPGKRFWSWVDDESRFGARVESVVADATARLAGLEIDAGNIEGARVACEQGLLASPIDVTLVTTLTEVYMRLGKPGLARRLVDSWEEKIGRMECGEPSDEPRKRLVG